MLLGYAGPRRAGRRRDPAGGPRRPDVLAGRLLRGFLLRRVHSPALQHPRAVDPGAARRPARRVAHRHGPGAVRRGRHRLGPAPRPPRVERHLLQLLRDVLLHRAEPRHRPLAARPRHRAPVRLHPDGRLLRVLDRLLHHSGPRPALRSGRRIHRLVDDDADRPDDQRHDQQPREDEVRRLSVGPHDDLGCGPDRGLAARPRRLLDPASDRGGARDLDGLLPVPLRDRRDRRNDPRLHHGARRRRHLRPAHGRARVRRQRSRPRRRPLAAVRARATAPFRRSGTSCRAGRPRGGRSR